MLVSYNWLKQYIDIDMSPSELTEVLNMSGMPVEEIIEKKADVSGVVSAKILKIDKHPDADKLSYCDVTDGTEEFKIVCGAQNIKEGMVVPLAKIGSILPGNFKIKKTKIRGIESQGMMCSAKELGLGDDHSGIMSLDESKNPLGSEYTPFESDTVLNLEITPNRADLLCMTGVARFIAAILKKEYKAPNCGIDQKLLDNSIDINKELTIENKSPEKCLRYTARLIKGVTVQDSPEWLKEKLLAIDMKPINNIVDITNYVLMELNHPLHAFDMKKVRDSKIIIRTANKGEKITALDEKEYTLSEDDLLITDPSGPIAIAGTMGGLDTSVDDNTTDIILEAAYFSPKSVRKTSRSLALSSDSSYRFERGISIETVQDGLNRAAAMMAEIAGGKVSADFIDNYPVKVEPAVVDLRFDRVNKILGSDISKEEISEIIKRVGLNIKESSDTALKVEIPGFRVDMTSEIDLIEDVAQVYGYNNIPGTLPVTQISAGSESGIAVFEKNLARIMTSMGFSEAVNYSFLNNKVLKDIKADSYIPENPAKIKNPFNEEETHMKTTLIPDLIKNLISNYNNENENIHLFETSKIFSEPEKGTYVQSPYIGCISYGYLTNPAFNKNSFKSDLYYLKSTIEALLKFLGTDKSPEYSTCNVYSDFLEYTMEIKLDGVVMGYAGQLKEEIAYDNKLKEKAFIFELDTAAMFKMYNPKIKYSKISHFPVVKRDISLLIDSDIAESKVRDIIRSDYSHLIKSLHLFDLYKGEQVPQGKKSLAYNIVFQSSKKTLSEVEINKAFERIVSKLKENVNAEMRS